MGKRERYIVTLTDGTRKNVLAGTFSEVVQMLGEENVTLIEKLDYEEPEEEK